MSEQPSLIFCPDCAAPLAPEVARIRLKDGGCKVCHVQPPTVRPGELLYCSRTGKELQPDDFATGKAIRVGGKCFSADAVQEARHQAAESGNFACDMCSATLKSLDFLSGDAVVIDKVILCPKCFRKNPDPAGNGRSRPKKKSASESSRERQAVKIKTPAGGTPVPDTPPGTPVTGTLAAAHSPDSGPASAAAVGTAESESVVEFQPVANSAMTTETPPSGMPAVVAASAASMNGPFAAESNGSPARRSPGRTLTPPARHARGLGKVSIDGRIIEVTRERDLGPQMGALVMMVIFLSGLLLFFFMRVQTSAADNPETIARLKYMEDRLDRMAREMGRLELIQEMYEKQLAAGFNPLNPTAANPGPIAANSGPTNPPPATAGTPTANAGTPGATPTNEPPVTEPPPDPPDPRIEALSAKSPAERLDAVLTVHQSYLIDAVPQLIERVSTDTDPYVRAFAIKALVTFRAQEARPVLQKLAGAENVGIVGDAARDALATLGE